MSKSPFDFKPAPRPRVDPDAARQMAAESADLGFTRTTSVPRIDPSLSGGGEPQAGTDSAPAPLPDSPTEPLPQGPDAQAAEGEIEPSVDRPTEPPDDEASARPTKRAKAPSSNSDDGLLSNRSRMRSAEGAKARRAMRAIAQGRNPAVARPLDGATAQLAKGHFASIAGTVKLDVQEPLWTELRVQAAMRRVSIRYLVHEALANYGYTVDLDDIPKDGRRER